MPKNGISPRRVKKTPIIPKIIAPIEKSSFYEADNFPLKNSMKFR